MIDIWRVPEVLVEQAGAPVVEQACEVAEQALRSVRIGLGPNSLSLAERGHRLMLSGSEREEAASDVVTALLSAGLISAAEVPSSGEGVQQVSIPVGVLSDLMFALGFAVRLGLDDGPAMEARIKADLKDVLQVASR